MEGISQELLIVGGAALVILAALILVKWGKQILTALLIIAGVVIVGLIGWALIVPYFLQSAEGGLWCKPPPLGAESLDGLQSALADVAGEKPTGLGR